MKQISTGIKAIVSECEKVDVKDGSIYANRVYMCEGETTIFGTAWTKDPCEKGDILNVYVTPVWKDGKYTGLFKLRFVK